MLRGKIATSLIIAAAMLVLPFPWKSGNDAIVRSTRADGDELGVVDYDLPPDIPATPSANEVYVYNNVPAEGNPNEVFTYTVTLSGTCRAGFLNHTLSGSSTFDLKKGEYAKLSIESSDGSGLNNYAHVYVRIAIIDIENNNTPGTDIEWSLGLFSGSIVHGSFSNEKITITQAENADYGTEVDLASETPSGSITCSDAQRSAEWCSISGTDDQLVGGTIVYTNRVRTEEVQITNNLSDPVEPSSTFNYTYTYAYPDGPTLGTDSFSVTGSAQYSIPDIPRGTVVNVTQEVSAPHDTTAALVQSVTVSSTGNAITYNNTRKTYTIDLSETTIGGTGSDAFEFTITKTYNGTTLLFPGDAPYLTTTLRSGDTFSITGIPYGAELMVVQAEYDFETISTDGNTVSERIFSTGPVTSNGYIAYTNTEPSKPAPTGLPEHAGPFILLLMVGGVFLTGFVLGKGDKEETEGGGSD